MKWGEWELETVWRREWLANTLWFFFHARDSQVYVFYKREKFNNTSHSHTQANAVSFVWLWQSIVIVVWWMEKDRNEIPMFREFYFRVFQLPFVVVVVVAVVFP